MNLILRFDLNNYWSIFMISIEKLIPKTLPQPCQEAHTQSSKLTQILAQKIIEKKGQISLKPLCNIAFIILD